jgi:hypothetical protein
MSKGPRANEEDAPVASPVYRVARVALLVASAAFGVFYLMIAAGGASFVHECNNLACAQLHQAVFAAVAGLALFAAAYLESSGSRSALAVAFLGTLPILIVHVVLVIVDPNESIFFPLSSAPAPIVSGALLLFRVRPGAL